MNDLPPTNQMLAKTDGLTVRQQNFARIYAATGHAMDSYRAAYGCENSSRATIRVNASRLLHNPAVAARIRSLQEAAGARSLRDSQSLVAELEAVVDANPNELLCVWVGACRRCHGQGHKHQWTDADEFADACDAIVRENAGLPATMQKPLPSCEGGFGYSFHADPSPDCPACHGIGLNKVRLQSSDAVSPAAQRLMRGVELHPDGSLKRLHTYDQFAMRVELHRLRGMHVDRALNFNVNANVPSLKDLTPEQALEFLDRLKPLPA
ncbi:MAG TPA: terminase small subunit [Steroidobacteraceae bacterium]|nr:terminase small subunit [Steroidobacteraceae bacterium]